MLEGESEFEMVGLIHEVDEDVREAEFDDCFKMGSVYLDFFGDNEFD